jgi:hypothetical protein
MPLRAGTIIAAVLAREVLVKSKRASVLFRFTWIVLIAFHSLGGWSNAAEIKCAVKWGLFAKDAEAFPSDRRPSSDACYTLLVEGEVASGNADKFAELLRLYHPFVDRVLLSSPGGLVEEALKIGKLVRTAMLITEAPLSWGKNGEGLLESGMTGEMTPGRTICEGSDCNCASACFLVWAAGIKREGGLVGLHRLSVRSTRFADLPPPQASALYRQLASDVKEYLAEMEVPRRFIDIMMDTSSSGIYWATLKDAAALKEVPSIAEWLSASCGTNSFEQAMDELMAGRTDLRDLSAREMTKYQTLAKPLAERDNEISSCVHKKINNSRDAVRF